MRRVFLLIVLAASAHATNYYVTIAGLGGAQEYESQFEKWANDLDRELKANGREARVTTLSGPSATRHDIERILNGIATEAKPEDSFALLLIGHGSFDGTDYKFNIPGPDITGNEFARLLNSIPARRQLFVNMTSCSGASIPALVKKDRIVITATKSGTEKNATIFARYWVDALKDPAADTDKNGTVSALEAFRYAQGKTAAYFESEKLLATEHALLSDSGSKDAARDPKPENGQGLKAAVFPVLRSEVAQAKNVAPVKQKLVAKKEDLEARIDRLKYQKAAMSPDEYKQQLTQLLLELAKTQAEIDR